MKMTSTQCRQNLLALLLLRVIRNVSSTSTIGHDIMNSGGSLDFRRDLVSNACLKTQEAIAMSNVSVPVNFSLYGNWTDDYYEIGVCETFLDDQAVSNMNCNFADSSWNLDVEKCHSLGGTEASLSYKMKCDSNFTMVVKNRPVCLSEECGVNEIRNFIEDQEECDLDLFIETTESSSSFHVGSMTGILIFLTSVMIPFCF